jgi:N-methylhydantoinase A/oxoprolinase/acetone carboxylase beta subunit
MSMAEVMHQPNPSFVEERAVQQRIGIDVGGTNTDAVLMQGQEVVGWVKTPTTADVTIGIVTALQELLQQTAAVPSNIRGVMLGTTHFTNAVVQRRHLSPVAAVRLGLPATACVPPLTDWPEDLRELVGQATYMLPGGHEGRRTTHCSLRAASDETRCLRYQGARHYGRGHHVSLFPS